MSFYHEKFKYRKTNFVENIVGSLSLLRIRYVFKQIHHCCNFRGIDSPVKDRFVLISVIDRKTVQLNQTGNVFEPGFCCQQNIVSVFIPGRDIRSGIGKHFNMPQKSLPAYKFINSGKGGDTIGGGLARLESAVLKHRAAYLIIGLGAYDYWRGKRSLSELEKDYDLILSRCSSSGMKIVIISCFGNEKLPENVTPVWDQAGISLEQYACGIADIERDLVKRYQAQYVPDMQCNILPKGRSDLWSDSNHPNASGNRIVADTILPALKKILPGSRP
jgi:lysophospholipase L1-like esterase